MLLPSSSSSGGSWATRVLWVCLVVLGGWTTVAEATLVETCEQQSSCLKVTMTEADAGSCVDPDQGGVNNCQFLVCVQLLFDMDGNSGCPKSVRESLSYSCIPAEDDCQGDPTGLVGESFQQAEYATKMMHLEQQCQVAGPGTEVQFLFRDGDGGCTGGRYDIDGFTAACGPSTGQACSGTTTDIGTECVWSFRTPATCTPTPAPRDGGLFGDTVATTTMPVGRPLPPTPTTTTTTSSPVPVPTLSVGRPLPPTPTTTTTSSPVPVPTLSVGRPLPPTPTTTTTETTTTTASGGATMGIRTLPPQGTAEGGLSPTTTTPGGGGGRSLPPVAALGGRPLLGSGASLFFPGGVPTDSPVVVPTDSPVVVPTDSPVSVVPAASNPTDSPLISAAPVAFDPLNNLITAVGGGGGPTDSPLVVDDSDSNTEEPVSTVVVGIDASPAPGGILDTREFEGPSSVGSPTTSSVVNTGDFGGPPTDPPFLSMLRSFGDANFTVMESNADETDCLCVDDFVNVASSDYTLSHRSYPAFGNTEGSRFFVDDANTTSSATNNNNGTFFDANTTSFANNNNNGTRSFTTGGAKVKLRKLEISEDGYFSYTDAAILYLGEELFEVSGTNEYYLNKEPVNLPTRIGDYEIRLTDSNDDLEEITVDFPPNGYLVFTIMKGSLLEYLRVVNYKYK